MEEINLNEVIEELVVFLPTFNRKVLRTFGFEPKAELKNILSPLLMLILLTLSEQEPLTVSELANKIMVSKQQMTPLINKLIEKQFVYRKQAEADRRNVIIVLTPQGHKFLCDAKEELANRVKKTLEKLNKEDLLVIHDSLTNIYKIMNKISSENTFENKG